MDFNLQFSVSASGDVEGTSTSIDGSPVTFHDVFTGTVTSPTFTETNKYSC